MREQLQKLIHKYRRYAADAENHDERFRHEIHVKELETILAANPQPAVRLRPGLVAKDLDGTSWFGAKPTFQGLFWYPDPDEACVYGIQDCIQDPWPDKPNGGPECLMEVKP